jgi:tetratricopeptide (TPR) repeat protein
MARRRLNKKVALIGSTVFLLLGLGTVVVILKLSRNPAQFIADGDVAWAAKDYDSARRNYSRAVGLTRSSSDKVDLFFKLADVYREMNDWRRVQACWEQIVTLDPRNVKARVGRLKYSYILADSLSGVGESISGYWKETLTQATEFMKIAEDGKLMDKPKADWEPSFGTADEPRWGGGARLLGPCLYFIAGRAAFEMASLGAVSSPDELLNEAQTSLQKARELDPNNVDIYYYLAQVVLQKGERAASRGSTQEKEASIKQAADILAQGVEATGKAPQAYVNLLSRKFAAARTGGIAAARTQMEALQPEYQALAEKFPQNPRVFAAVAEFYSVYSAYVGSAAATEALNRATEAIDKAAALDKNSVLYARFAARLYYHKYSRYKDEASLRRAIELAEHGRELPDAQDSPGPRQYAKQANKLSLCAFLTRCYVDRILRLDKASAERTALLAKAEQAVHEIEQIRGSGENPQVVMWQGMLELGKGHTGKAIKGLYAAYEQFKASGSAQQDPFLSYTLARIFKGTTEVGAVAEFLGSALTAGIIDARPDVLLDYAEVLLQARSYDMALSAVGFFDERFGETSTSKGFRVEALIGKGHISEAEDALSRLSPDDPNTLRLGLNLARAKNAQLRRALRKENASADALITFTPTNPDKENAGQSAEAIAAELRDGQRREADLMRRLLQAAPKAVEGADVARLCEMLVAQKDISTAREVVEAFLKQSADSPEVLPWRGLLSEPDPLNCPQARRAELQEQATGSIADPLRRGLELGLLYQQRQQFDKAVAQWREVLKATTPPVDREEPAYLQVRQLSPRHVAASYLFDLARHRKDWPLAEEIAKIAREDNLDDCGGYLFAARLAVAKGENKDALSDLDECLRQRPIFSYGYMLRGNVQSMLDNERAAVDDLKKAAALNPIDPLVAKALANALYARNSKLGDKLSSEQKAEAKGALEHAIYLDPQDTNLLNAYADQVSDGDPMKALALRQTIQTNAPSVLNAVRLGQLATQIALKETDEAKKRAFFTVAESAFEQARQAEPANQLMLESYAEYYRARGQSDKAAQLLAESKDSQLLWRHYFRIGRSDEAEKLLLQMYAEPKNKADALKGLILLAEGAADRDKVKKYSEELLSLEDSVINRLAQIRAYLDVGLVPEAEQQLQSLKQEYPNDPRTGLMEALLAKQQGDLDKAFALVNRSLQDNQQNPALWRLRGEIGFLKGDYDQAVADLKKSRSLEDDPVTATMLAKTYLWAGKDEEAISELQGILKRSEPPLEARLLLESIYLRLDRKDALQQLYTDTLAQYPDSVDWMNRAGTFAINQRDYARAEALYTKAYQIKQQSVAPRSAAEAVRDLQYAAALDGYLLSLVLAAGEPGAAGGAWHPEKLDKVFQEGAKYVDTPYGAGALYRMAEAKKRLGDVEGTRDYCRKAVSKAWDDERVAVEILLQVYMLMGSDEVSKYCRERLQTTPDSLAANFTMFNLAKIKEDYGEAVNYIDKCIELCPADSDLQKDYVAKKAQILAVAYKKTSDNAYLVKAIGLYESLLEKMPKNSDVVLNNLAYMLAQNDQKLDKALEYAKKALELKPNEANYHDTYGYVLYKNGRNAEAVQSLTAATQQYEAQGTPSPEAYEHLGMVHEALRDNKRALAAYRRALEVGAGTMPEIMKNRVNSAIGRLTQ